MAIDKIITTSVTDDSITLAKMASGTDGNIISYDASGNPVAVATGSSGQVLTSAGAGAVPSFQALASGGKIGQVVSHYLTALTEISAGSYVATGLTLNITPSATSSKLFLLASVSVSGSSTDYNQTLAFFNGSSITGANSNNGNQIGGTSQSRTHTSVADSVVMSYLDAPGTTNQITYSVKLYGEAGITHYVNKTGEDNSGGSSQAHKGRTTSSLTVFEVLA